MAFAGLMHGSRMWRLRAPETKLFSSVARPAFVGSSPPVERWLCDASVFASEPSRGLS